MENVFVVQEGLPTQMENAHHVFQKHVPLAEMLHHA
jgi:hypothetical protein